MKKLYKYMPFRQSFFDDPLLRLTPPSEFNDPFDSKPTQLSVHKRTDAFFNEDNSYEEKYNFDLITFYKNDLYEHIENFGIISLSERHDNLLMWAHYAKSHDGIAVAISCEGFTFDCDNPNNSSCATSSKYPVKIEYSNNRPGHEMPDQVLYDYFEDEFFNLFLTIKGNDWSYEQEHRFLFNRNEFDVAIVDVKTDINYLDKSKFSIQQIEESKFKIEPYTKNDNMSLLFNLAFGHNNGNIENTKLFKRLNKNAIKTIYFGCRVSEKNIHEAIKTMKESDYFSCNTEFYKCIENKDFFKIQFIKLEI